MIKKLIKKLIRFFSLKILSPIHWTFIRYFITGETYLLTAHNREYARALMDDRLYLWVSRRGTHLSTHLIVLSDWVLSFLSWMRGGLNGRRPRIGFYSHAFFNCSKNEIVEAVGKGVQKVYFDDVFDCDSVAALVPSNLTKDEWSSIQLKIVDGLSKVVGRDYDPFYDINDSTELSCIELVRHILMENVKDYQLKFAQFEKLIKEYGNVTPQMLYDSTDFMVVWEVRK